jgi:hypothetical protein
MVYEYWTSNILNEHMLKAGEIADLYHVTSSTNKPHAQLIQAILDEYDKEHPDLQKFYYMTRYGMMRVYPRSSYVPAMEKFIEIFQGSHQCSTFYNGKNFLFNMP